MLSAVNAMSVVKWLTELYLYQSVGQTDEDFQMDDALLDRAARKQSQSHIESRERQLAIIGLLFCVICTLPVSFNTFGMYLHNDYLCSV